MSCSQNCFDKVNVESFLNWAIRKDTWNLVHFILSVKVTQAECQYSMWTMESFERTIPKSERMIFHMINLTKPTWAQFRIQECQQLLLRWLKVGAAKYFIGIHQWLIDNMKEKKPQQTKLIYLNLKLLHLTR